LKGRRGGSSLFVASRSDPYLRRWAHEWRRHTAEAWNQALVHGEISGGRCRRCWTIRRRQSQTTPSAARPTDKRENRHAMALHIPNPLEGTPYL